MTFRGMKTILLLQLNTVYKQHNSFWKLRVPPLERAFTFDLLGSGAVANEGS